MKKLLLALLLVTVNSCAPKQESAPCAADFQGSGMAIKMEFKRKNSDGSDAYLVQLCGDSKPSPIVYTVYGATSAEAAISNPASAFRLQHIQDSSHSGAQFEVNFKSNDNWFAIYQDRVTSAGYAYDTTNELVRGNLDQAVSIVSQ